MQIHTLDKATIINELRFGGGLSQAIQDGRRADFALLVSMFSNDAREATPIEKVNCPNTSEQLLRQQFGLSEPQPLRSDASSYTLSAEQARQFHQAGLPSAKLSHYLQPDALAYLPEATYDLPEEVYHNLSGHERRQLSSVASVHLPDLSLYNQLTTAFRQDQLHIQS